MKSFLFAAAVIGLSIAGIGSAEAHNGGHHHHHSFSPVYVQPQVIRVVPQYVQPSYQYNVYQPSYVPSYSHCW